MVEVAQLLWASEFIGHGALAGVDVAVTEFFFLTGEGKYSWAQGALDEYSFEGFDKMDLSGLQFTVGFSARF